jgi:hypothetical protein
MATIQRSIKRGDVRQFDESYQKGFKSAWASEVDADFNILYDAWNFGLDGGLVLADGSVTTPKLADGSVTNNKLAPNSVGSGNIIDGAVTTVDIQDGAVTAAKIAGGVIDLSKLAANSVDASKIVDGSVGSAELAANSVTTIKIADLNVTTPKLADGAVTDAKITSVAWAKITGAPTGMAPSGVAGGSLAGTYPNPTIQANAVGPAEILDGCISVAELAPNVAQRLVPIYGVPDSTKVLTVNPTGDALVWAAAPPATLTPGQVTTIYIADAPNGVTDAKITSISYAKVTGHPTAYPPSGPAGGDLAGTYPNPTVRAGLIPVIPTSLPPSGPAGGNLTGNYPNPTIGVGQVTNAMIADVAWSKLTGTTAAGGELAGTYPNPTHAPTGVTAGNYGSSTSIPAFNVRADGRIASVSPVTVSIPPGTTIAATPPANPVQGQLWWRNDPDGNLFISYDDGNSTQWVPAVPASSGPVGPAGGDLSGTYPNPTVVKSAGSFTVGGTLTLPNLATPASDAFIFGNAAIAAKSYIGIGGDNCWALRYNVNAAGSALNDPAKSGWLVQLQGDDTFNMYRCPPTAGAPAFTRHLFLDNLGKLHCTLADASVTVAMLAPNTIQKWVSAVVNANVNTTTAPVTFATITISNINGRLNLICLSTLLAIGVVASGQSYQIELKRNGVVQINWNGACGAGASTEFPLPLCLNYMDSTAPAGSVTYSFAFWTSSTGTNIHTFPANQGIVQVISLG